LVLAEAKIKDDSGPTSYNTLEINRATAIIEGCLSKAVCVPEKYISFALLHENQQIAWDTVKISSRTNQSHQSKIAIRW